MKRVWGLIFVFVLILAVASCGGKKKENPAYEEQVSKEIKAEEGGKVESSDGKTSIEIPADALDENTKITMTIYDISAYSAIADKVEGKKVVSKVVEFEPSGTIFKKPVIISMTTSEAFENKIVSAAVFYEQEGRLSYSEHGAYAILDRDAAGDPIMTTGAGDPIMNSAAGDPIMLASAGDPIMTSAAGDPIMNSAAGDPIMMTTGHFTAYAVIVSDPKEPEEEPEEPEKDEEVTDKDEEPVVEDDDDDISDIEISDEDDDIEIPEEDDDEPIVEDDDEPVVDEDIIVPEPPVPVLSKVLCTGQTKCSDGESIIDCPAEGEDFYGQDAQFVATKSCVPHKYSRQSEPIVAAEEPEEGSGTGLRAFLSGKSIRGGVFRDGDSGESYDFVLDENTGLKWLLFNESADHSEAESKCADLTYGGHEWRLPTAKEFLSIADHDRFDLAANEYYFRNVWYDAFWTGDVNVSSGREDEFWVYNSDYAFLFNDTSAQGAYYAVACVSGEEYGKVNAENYDSRTINGHEVVSDSSTNLLWQKGSKSVKNWKEALAYCQNLEYAGYSDWRLPNKNELITIVDYSKADPASSFPGMTSDLLISSTFTVVYGGAEHAIAVHMDSGMVDEYYDSMSVRCVRSDFQPLPAEQPLPYCDESRIGPCEDAATGYVWSSPDIDYGYNNSANPQNYQSVPVTWQKKAIQCRESNEGGISKWRIPTVDEIRTLFPSDEILKTNGECHVTNACFDYLSEDCFNDVCAPGNTPSEVGREKVMSSLFDSGVYFSGTFTDADSHDTVWFVDMRKDSVKRSEEYYDGYGASQSRCIRDDSLPNPVVFPYTDSENGLVWSSLSKKRLQYWYEVAKYCTELVEGGSNNWRVPSMEELWTLVKNCPDGDCVSNTTGEYSVLGDLSNLWSSEISSGDSDNVHLFKFMTASEDSQPIYSENFAKVRCVRSLSDSENVLEFDEESDFPHRLPDLVWSKVSDEEYYNSEDAVAYCNELNEEGYGGETQWTLPTSSELASIINKRVCSNKNDFLTGTTSGRCSQYSFGGYSYFGDMFSLKAEGDYVFDFVQGKMDSYGYGRVRCVVVPPDDAF